MDDITRAVGRLEGRLDEMAKRLDDGVEKIHSLVESNVMSQQKLEVRVQRVEQKHAFATGWVAAIVAFVSVSVSVVTKKFL